MNESFQDQLKKSVKNVKNLKDAALKIIQVLEQFSKEGGRIGYVAGIITSGGDNKIDENVKRLIENTENIRKETNFLIFSATDIFGNEIVNHMEEHKLGRIEEEKGYKELFRKILGSGFVTDIFMTQGWERSSGAKDELATAKKNKLEIHF